MKTLCRVLFVVVVLHLSGITVLAGHTSGHGMDSKQPESVPASASHHADVRKHNACPHCGMYREKFSQSRMLITYSNGFSVGVCSVRCAVIELKASKTKIVKSVEVADFHTRNLISAENAFWVIGGSKKGVMTAAPKWAFKSRDAANTFIKSNGGTLATYKGVLSIVEKD